MSSLHKKASNSFDEERLKHPASESPADRTITPSPSLCRPEPSVSMDGHFEGSFTVKQAHGAEKAFSKGGQSQVTIDMLPDIALLRIFDFYLDKAPIEAWKTLVHTCPTWRNVVFGSPRRLNLRLDCRASTSVRKMLDVWPPLPIFIKIGVFDKRSMDNIIAALEHNDRICELDIYDTTSIPISERENLSEALQQPFPALTDLQIIFLTETRASFLAESAPGLQLIDVDLIPFRRLPKLLLTATHLRHLILWGIPHPGCILPEAMVTCLSTLTRLETIKIAFECSQCRPDPNIRRPPPHTRIHLPVLTLLSFEGVAEYLEDLVAPIDAPLLDDLRISFIHQMIFDTPQLTQLISRTPKFNAYCDARVEILVEIFHSFITVTIPQASGEVIELGIWCLPSSNSGLSSAVRLCGSSFHPALISAVKHLYIMSDYSIEPCWQETSSEWLEFFYSFTAVKDLYISSKVTSRIAPALQQLVGDRVTEVLPALKALFLEETPRSGPVQEAIEQFIAARQLASHAIVVSQWQWERKRRSIWE